MKLWLIEQNVNNGYDTYENAVVAAETEEAAVDTYPGSFEQVKSNKEVKHNAFSAWAENKHVRATYIGETRDGMPAGVVCASFNAG